MALNFKSLNGMSAIKKIGINQSAFDWLAQSQVVVKLKSNKFTFYFIDDHGKETLKEVPVTIDDLQQLNAGKLPLTKKITLSGALAKAIQDLMIAAGEMLIVDEGMVVLHEDPGDGIEKTPISNGGWGPTLTMVDAGALAHLPPLHVIPAKGVEQSSAWGVFDLHAIKTAFPVKLRDADKMYQPVRGTSVGSRYYMVGANKDIRVAARLQGGSLSVRIEGPGLAKHQNAISEAGITINAGKDYASVHLNVGGDMVLASKTLGAVLMGLGVTLDTPMPNLALIKGA
jgi:hypothetical protein